MLGRQFFGREISFVVLLAMILCVFLPDTSGGVGIGKISIRHKDEGIKMFSIKDNPYKYSGYYFDSESGMFYCQARYYSPELIRFINRDTYDLSNRYAYCDGDPVRNVDPIGHNALSFTLLTIATFTSLFAVIFSLGTLTGATASGLTVFGAIMGAAGVGFNIMAIGSEASKNNNDSHSWSDWSWRKEDAFQNVASIVGIVLDFASLTAVGRGRCVVRKVRVDEMPLLPRRELEDGGLPDFEGFSSGSYYPRNNSVEAKSNGYPQSLMPPSSQQGIGFSFPQQPGSSVKPSLSVKDLRALLSSTGETPEQLVMGCCSVPIR